MDTIATVDWAYSIQSLKTSIDKLNFNIISNKSTYSIGNDDFVRRNSNVFAANNSGSMLSGAMIDYNQMKENTELNEEIKSLKLLVGQNELRQTRDRLKAEVQDRYIKNPENANQALLGAGYKLEREFGTVFTNITTLTSAAAISMRDNMSNFFFDAMTGKIKSFEEYFQNFVNAIKKAVSQLLSNMIMKGITDLIMPGKKASGGRVASGTPFVAGEHGPELISLDGAGATVISSNTTQSMLGGQSNLAVEVNVINQSGTQMQASQGETRFDGQRYVVDVFLDAWARDVSGLRSAVAGRG